MNSLNFVNGRSQFSQNKYQKIICQLLIDKDNTSLISECTKILHQINYQKESIPLSEAIKYIKKRYYSDFKSELDENIQFRITKSMLHLSIQWGILKQNFQFNQFISELCGEKQRTSIDFNEIEGISLFISFKEFNELKQLQNEKQQIQKILEIIILQTAYNFQKFMNKCKNHEIFKWEYDNDILVKFHITNSTYQQLNQSPQFKDEEYTDKKKIYFQNQGDPNRIWSNFFSNSDRVKQIMQIEQLLIEINQSNLFEKIKQIFPKTSDLKEILDEIIETLSLASCIIEQYEALQKYCKSIIDDDSKKQQALNNVQESCEQVIQQCQQFQQFSIKDCEIKYFDFNTQQNDYQNYLKDHKPNETPKKYQYEIDNKGIQMYSDDLNNNKSIYISVSFNQYEQKVRGMLGNAIIDEDHTMLRISFVQINEFEKLVQSVINKNDDQTKLLVKCLMISASSLIYLFTKTSVISFCFEKNKKLYIDFKLPKDDKQINDLIWKIQQQK